MHYHRHIPIVCSLLTLTGAASPCWAQAPLLPPLAPVGNIAQASPAAVPPAAPPAVPTTPSSAPVDATPAPLDPNAPAPIAPPPVITGGTGAAPIAVPVDAGANTANPGGARAREFQGDDTGQVLRLLARQAKINLIVSDQVVGTINMRLEDVTALQAIQVICQAKGYDLAQTSGVYYVKTPAEKAAEPTQSDYYTFSYARASQVVPLLTSQLKSKSTPPQVDERTNTVFYQEAKSNVGDIRKFLLQIDRPTRQVMIEARLVEVNSNPTQSYGINWGGVFGSAAAGKTFAYGGSGLATPPTQGVQVQAQRVINNGTASQQVVPAYGPNGNPIYVNGPTTPGMPATETFTNGILGLNTLVTNGGLDNLGSLVSNQLSILSIPQFSATLRLLNEDVDAEFLANPRIVTADNLEATIKIVRNQPVPQLNFNEQTATAVFSGFQDKVYGNTLVVKPSINKDNFITLSVKPEISNRVGDQAFNFAGATVTSPIIDTRSLESNVLIKSGCTLAIGGLLQDESSKGTTKVPILGDIPVLGYLFQEHLNSRSKRNLLIFVTPTIVSQQYGTGLEDQITGLKNSSLTKGEYADINGWKNNAQGAIRLKKTEKKSLASQYPAPGDCNDSKVSFKQSATARGD